MCTIEEHMLKWQTTDAGFKPDVNYNGEFSCSTCNQVILIVRHGIRFIPEYIVKEMLVK